MENLSNPALEAIYSRRSVREFEDRPVPIEMILEVIKAGTWAPSGLNNQPWRFAIVTNPATKAKFEPLTKYDRIIRGARALIAVFVDKEAMYHPTKDHQAIGACLQNMLLAAHSMGLGGVWLGEIIKSDEEVRALLGLDDGLELMAVIALGFPARKDRKSRRNPLESVILYKD